MGRISLEVKEFEGKKYYYTDVGSGWHGAVNFRLWVNASLVRFDAEDGSPYIDIPVQNARIVKTERGNYVLRPAEGWCVYHVGVECGYRGTSSVKVLEPEDAEVFEYEVYSSPVGSLGISHYAFVNAKTDRIKVEWDRDGRLYDKKPHGITIHYADGTKEVFDGITDGIEALKELEGDAQ